MLAVDVAHHLVDVLIDEKTFDFGDSFAKHLGWTVVWTWHAVVRVIKDVDS